jgi:hypothetical protein
VPLHMATVLTYPERVTEYSLAKLKQRVAAGMWVLHMSYITESCVHVWKGRGEAGARG